jgi:hypothetical protein
MAKAGNKPTPKSQGKGLFKLGFDPVDLSGLWKVLRRRERLERLQIEELERWERLRDNRVSPSPPVSKLSGKAWVPVAYARRPKELLAMGITKASRVLAAEYETDCARRLTARYVEKQLRKLGAFQKAYRGSPK